MSGATRRHACLQHCKIKACLSHCGKRYDCGPASELHLSLRLIHACKTGCFTEASSVTISRRAAVHTWNCLYPLPLQANMHALASELERVKTELNDRTAMMGAEMERWRQQADATSTQVLLHHARVIHCCAGVHAMRQHANSGKALRSFNASARQWWALRCWWQVNTIFRSVLLLPAKHC